MTRLPAVERAVLAALLLGAVATVVGAVWLWPSHRAPRMDPYFAAGAGTSVVTDSADVVAVERTGCGSPDAGRVLPGPPLDPRNPETTCLRAIVTPTSGPDTGRRVLLEIAPGPGAPSLTVGDPVRLGRSTGDGGVRSYTFEDYIRGLPLLVWAVVALVAVVVVGAWRGLRAVLGIGWALLVIVGFVLPALLDGRPAAVVALVGAAAVMYPVVYLVHGFGPKSHAALAGTLAGLGLAAALGSLTVATCRVTGLGEESTAQVQTYLQGVQSGGLLLAGLMIGVLGVLNDVTVAQAATVFQLAHTDPGARPRRMFALAMEVGRDHLASVVYTLVLAYAGAALPLLLLLSAGGRPLLQILTSDVVAVEIVRSLVGVVALAACVPLTTGLAVLLARRMPDARLARAAEGAHAH